MQLLKKTAGQGEVRHYGWEACVGLLINHFSQARGREIDLTYRPAYEGLLYAFMSKKIFRETQKTTWKLQM